MRSKTVGFTLIEILVVMAIFVTLMTFTLVVSFESYKSYAFKSEQDMIVSALLKARSQSVNNINAKPHGVRIHTSPLEYVIFQGTDYAHRDTNQDVVLASGNVQVTAGGASELVFSQLTGKPIAAGNITLDDHVHPLVTININSQGGLTIQ